MVKNIDVGKVPEGKERDSCVDATKKEMGSMEDRYVSDQMQRTAAYQKHRTSNNVKSLPSMIVLVSKPLEDQKHGCIQKSGMCVCGNFRKYFQK